MEMLGLKETVVQMAKANGVRWYGHVLRRDGHVLWKALVFKVEGKRKRGKPKKIWKTQVEKESKSVGLEKRMPWIKWDGEWELDRLLAKWGKSGQPRLQGINLDQNWMKDGWSKEARTGVSVYFFLIIWKESLQSAVHFHSTFFFVNCCMGSRLACKFGRNLAEY